MSLTAIIPARAGSRRVPDKNMRLLEGVPLVERKVHQLHMVAAVDQVVVSTDCPLVGEVARAAGATVQDRPPEYCDEVSKSWGEMVAYVCSRVEGEWVIISPCTAPLVMPSMYRRAIAVAFGLDPEGPHRSVVAARKIQTYLWNESGPVNYRLDAHPPSQALPPFWRLTGGFFIARREDMIRWEYHHCGRPSFFELDGVASVDIDTEADLRLARFLYSIARDREYGVVRTPP